MATNLPTPIFSENEDPALAKYHGYLASENGKVDNFFMPRSEEELRALFNLYTSGAIKDSRFGMPAIERIWRSLVDNIKEEFTYRCMDGNKVLVDEYLAHFHSFIKIIDGFPEQSFLENLYKGHNNLVHSLNLFVINVERRIGEGRNNLTRESTHLPYTVNEIDKILKESRHFKEADFAEHYRKYHLTEEYKECPEFQAAYNAISGAFSQGVSLMDFIPQE
jgi:hypothetical protein